MLHTHTYAHTTHSVSQKELGLGTMKSSLPHDQSLRRDHSLSISSQHSKHSEYAETKIDLADIGDEKLSTLQEESTTIPNGSTDDRDNVITNEKAVNGHVGQYHDENSQEKIAHTNGSVIENTNATHQFDKRDTVEKDEVRNGEMAALKHMEMSNGNHHNGFVSTDYQDEQTSL